MKVSVCIASRGRPEKLEKTIHVLTGNATLADTIIAVALDLDDYMRPQYDTLRNAMGKRCWVSTDQREDSLGAKYNRAQHHVLADLYVLWADDMVMPEPGWDARLAEAASRLPDNCGALLFGQIPGVLQPGLAVTHKLVEAMGFFNVPYFPFWWGETWTLEIVTMADCYVHADVKVELLDTTKGTSRGVREINLWAELFDRLRPSRRAVAETLINKSNRTLAEKAALFARLPALEAQWLNSNSVLRDPVRAAELERHYSFDAPADERYLRLKAKAETMLAELRNGRP